MKKVLLLLADGFEAYEAAVFTDILGWTKGCGSEKVEVVTAGMHRTLKCAFVLEVVPALQLSEVKIEEFDALAIPGGFEEAGFYQDAYSPEFLAVIRQFAVLGKPIASICVGALPLGKSGILKGKRATTYHLLEGKRRQQLAELGAIVINEPLVKDSGIITSTSPATAVDVAFALLEELTSPENAMTIKKYMGFESF